MRTKSKSWREKTKRNKIGDKTFYLLFCRFPANNALTGMDFERSTSYSAKIFNTVTTLILEVNFLFFQAAGNVKTDSEEAIWLFCRK